MTIFEKIIEFTLFQNSADSAIVHKIGYSYRRTLSADWLKTDRANECSSSYEVVRYTDYASSLHEFIKKYPNFTIEQCNYALSEKTFGNKSTGCRDYEFDTVHFNNNDYYGHRIVWDHVISDWNFDVGVEIAVHIKNENNSLYLRPCCNGWIYSVGPTVRELDFGLNITSVTFHPKTNKA